MKRRWKIALAIVIFMALNYGITYWYEQEFNNGIPLYIDQHYKNDILMYNEKGELMVAKAISEEDKVPGQYYANLNKEQMCWFDSRHCN